MANIPSSLSYGKIDFESCIVFLTSLLCLVEKLSLIEKLVGPILALFVEVLKCNKVKRCVLCIFCSTRFSKSRFPQVWINFSKQNV
jgi:hypothetical protein